MSLTNELSAKAATKKASGMQSAEAPPPALADAASTAPAAIDFNPAKKTTLDLFARAPQVKKPSRREMQRMLYEAQLRKKKASSASPNAHPDASSTPDGNGVFSTVLLTDDVEKEIAAQEQRQRKKGKHHILRHALHPNEEEDARTVFVGNLPNTVHKRDVEKIFKNCGSIESVRVRCQTLEEADEKTRNAGRAIRVLRGQIKKDDKYSATAYVLFRSASSLRDALAKNGVIYQSRHLVVTTLDAEGRAYPPDTSIFIGNIAYDTTEEDVWSFFSEHGITDVKRVRLIRDRETGDCKGFGYVEFQNRASVAPAIDTRGDKLNGREVRIVHVNKSKEVRSATKSRRERRQGGVADTQKKEHRKQTKRNRYDDRDGGADRKRVRADRADVPSWMGMTTNPRRKMPRDLRDLVEKKSDRPRGPRAPVKRKMRNPEKQ